MSDTTDPMGSNPYAPTARGARGRAVISFAEQQRTPDMHDDEPSLQVLQDVVHALVADVPRQQLPSAVGELLGTVAADLIVDRAFEARGMASDAEIWALGKTLQDAVGRRHWGGPDDY